MNTNCKKCGVGVKSLDGWDQNLCPTCLTWNKATPDFKPGQCAVYTDDIGTTHSVTIRTVDENVVRIHWLVKHHNLITLAVVPLSHAAARKRLVLFPPGEKFMVLEGGAK